MKVITAVALCNSFHLTQRFCSKFSTNQ